jgi:hypothetical protein
MSDSTHQPGANLESLFLDEEIVQREPSAESTGILDRTAHVEAEAPTASRIKGRILWPALGFPAVIAPTAGRETRRRCS